MQICNHEFEPILQKYIKEYNVIWNAYIDLRITQDHMAFLIYTSDNRMNMSLKECNLKRKQYEHRIKPALNENTSRCLFKKIIC